MADKSTASLKASALPTSPSAGLALALMARQINGAVDDANVAVNSLSDLLGQLMTQCTQPATDDSADRLVSLAGDMIAQLQFFDLLSQRCHHVSAVLGELSSEDCATADKLPGFDQMVSMLARHYSCEQEKAIQRAFLSGSDDDYCPPEEDAFTSFFDAD